MNRDDYFEEISEALIEEGIYDLEESNPSEIDLTEKDFNNLVRWYVDLAEAILDFAEDDCFDGEYAWFSIEKMKLIINSETWLETDQDEIRKMCKYHTRWGNLERDARVDAFDDAQMYRYRPNPDSCLEKVIEISSEYMENHDEETMTWKRKFEEMCIKCLWRENCKLQKMI